MTNEVKCKHYDEENGWCKKVSDWSDPMPHIVYCPKSPCEHAEPIEQPMTDNDIIKALECCMLNKKCEECPLCRTLREPCRVVLARGAFNLINRQKAEIERLQKENSENFNKWLIFKKRIQERYAELYEEAKGVVRAEAIKELAIRFNEMVTEIYNKHIFGYFDLDDSEKEAVMNFSGDITFVFDNLVKEMTEEQE